MQKVGGKEKMSEKLKANTTAYKREYVERCYDRISVTVPKGFKTAIEAHAANKGLSVNGLINKLLKADMGDAWPNKGE